MSAVQADVRGAVPVVPDHKVWHCIGEGSHGQVWLARSVLGVWRAVKVVRRGLFRDERPYDREFAGVQRFEPLSREDDGFVDVLHTGRNDAEGYFYYVMELADDLDSGPASGIDPGTYRSCTLGRVMAQRGRLDVETVVELGRRLAAALGRLHGAGLIHRDIKPSNIVFVGGKPKLADIGLVVEQTEARSYVGTDGYVAPEGPNSVKADLYSLGMVLYEAGMGLGRHEFPKPCEAMDGGSDARVLRELNAVILRACAAAPADRYATAAELGDDLACIASGGSVRRRHRVRRMRRALAWAAAVALAAGAAWATWAWQRAAWVEAGRRARVAEQEARTSHLLAASATRAMHDGDDAMALVWLSQVISAKESRGLAAFPERVLARQLKERLPEPRVTVAAGLGLFSVAYGPDGSRLVTSDDRGFACEWDAATGALVHGPIRCGQRPMQVGLCADGKRAWAAPRVNLPSFARPVEATGHVAWFDMASGRETGVRWERVGWAVESPDHRWLATADSAYGVGLGRADGTGPRLRLPAHTGPVEALVFSPDSALLASGSHDGSLRVWRVPDGTLHGQMRVRGMLRSIAWGPGSRTLLTLSMDAGQQRFLQSWEVADASERLPAISLGQGPSLLELSAFRGERWVVSGESRDLSIFQGSDGRRAFPDIPMNGQRCQAMAIGWDGRALLTGSADGHASLWSLEDGSRWLTLPHHSRAVRWVGFHPTDGSWFTGSEDGVIRLWRQREAQAPLPSPAGWTQWGPASASPPDGRGLDQAAWNDRGDILVTMASKPTSPVGPGAVVALDVRKGQWTTVAEGLEWSSPALVVSGLEGDSWAVSGLAPKDVPRSAATAAGEDVMWVTRGQAGWSFRRLHHARGIADVRVVGPERLVSVDATGVVRSWSPDGDLPELTAGQPNLDLTAHVLSGDGMRVATFDSIRRRLRIRHWNQPESAVVEFPTEPGMSGVRLLGRSNVFAANNIMSVASLWDASLGLRLPLRETSLGRVTCTDWNDARRLLLACPDVGPPVVVDAVTLGKRSIGGNELARSPLRAALGPDGRWVVTVDQQQAVRVYDAATGHAVTPALAHAGQVWWAGISPGHWLVTLSAPNQVRSWSLLPDTTPAPVLVRQAMDLAARRVDDLGREHWIEPEAPRSGGTEKKTVGQKDNL